MARTASAFSPRIHPTHRKLRPRKSRFRSSIRCRSPAQQSCPTHASISHTRLWFKRQAEFRRFPGVSCRMGSGCYRSTRQRVLLAAHLRLLGRSLEALASSTPLSILLLRISQSPLVRETVLDSTRLTDVKPDPEPIP